uniref:Uncharacterized protein n=1 Tax=Anguilla anguilla TaxID=7936 RepID=A0A0E9Q0V2_ANGAN
MASIGSLSLLTFILNPLERCRLCRCCHFSLYHFSLNCFHALRVTVSQAVSSLSMLPYLFRLIV